MLGGDVGCERSMACLAQRPMSHTLLPDNSHATAMFTLTQLHSSLSNNSNHRACCKLPLWKSLLSLCVCVCVWEQSECVFLRTISMKPRHGYHSHGYTLHQHPAVMHTPHIHSLNSHPALWCVLYYSILHSVKQAPTHTHTQTHTLPGTHEFPVHLNMPSHLVHTDTAVIWLSGTIGLCFIWCDLTAGQLEEEGNWVGSEKRVGGIQFQERRQIQRGISHRTETGVGGEERRRGGEEDLGRGEPWGEGDRGEGGASSLTRGTSSRAQAHFLFQKVNRQAAGVWGVMGKEETVMLIRPAHTSPSDNKTKQEWKQGGGGETQQTTVEEWGCRGPGSGLYIVMTVLRKEVLVNKERKKVIGYDHTAHL